jgi:hypothetical protein|uniref:Armadillo repeat-containing protein 8 n=1 Tax=Eutreptiella gymnastica TaxID=73025 RepID=A0A7S4LQ50_9EUGL|mmetsp:Transcript_39240/g.63794  ORF Transcript_39240/g.63794 Transcript_39240/m.63794 type:complete len:179 (+) Transcript_39240:27-563(+)|eukprot:CAMPEP_0174286230 /NCGR_PEP_ID=MMETSP0809-20121228/10962_1 /TAXON_ID=73025 ORGANISM="Eutreptiella gymnastica-like, Strain CCMP1594" /NCGR_SAMPLE_ID=MMETSP0809 /ASSEMBLY_ACC=CAM_ASM_000658 /LENGTH=178 /DNA_ID=CAMNT_0015382211 /DNA_START=17 /DNA_END=553 /DNA_ORIENTATION=+
MADEEDIGEEVGELDSKGEEEKRGAAIAALLQKSSTRLSESRGVLEFLPEINESCVDKAALKALVDGEAIGLIFSAMKTHCDNPQVLVAGCKALVFKGLKYQYNAPASQQVLGSGGVATIMAAIKRFPDDRDLQVAAIVALSHVVAGPENREALMRQGGVEVILDSVSRHNIRTSLPF